MYVDRIWVFCGIPGAPEFSFRFRGLCCGLPRLSVDFRGSTRYLCTISFLFFFGGGGFLLYVCLYIYIYIEGLGFRYCNIPPKPYSNFSRCSQLWTGRGHRLGARRGRG